MHILGLSAYLCDSSAALLKDGRLVGAIEEEKLVGRKHTGELPLHAIRHLLDSQGIGMGEISHVGYFFKPWRALQHRLWGILRHLPGSLAFYGSHGGIWLSMARTRQRLRAAFGLKEEPYRFHNLGHHLCHAASSYYLSGFPEAAVLVADGSGESAATSLYLARANTIEALDEIPFPHSLGYLYGAVTQYLGFAPNCDEGKVMGLAPYGKPEHLDLFCGLLRLSENGGYELDLSYFDFHRSAASLGNGRRWVSERFLQELGEPRAPGAPIEARHANIASSLQHRLNEALLHVARQLRERTGLPDLCLAGGVALNSVANGHLLRNSGFKRLFIQPAAGDGGASVGAALAVYHGLLDGPRGPAPEPAFLGPAYSEAEILRALAAKGLAFRKVRPAEEGARLLAAGKILGWFQGRAEFGPRALGHRSILADPRLPQIKDVLNRRVKRREPFRPFAPSILEERLPDYFAGREPSPVMLLVYEVLPEKRPLIPAVTHVDGTGRVQTVSRRADPLFYELIERFEALTGVPVLLNTSLNLRGMPIACTPEQALDCFLATELDALILGDALLLK